VRRRACNGEHYAMLCSRKTWGRTEQRASQRASRDHDKCGAKEKREREKCITELAMASTSSAAMVVDRGENGGRDRFQR
jgi:hypothetical protein